MGTTCVYFTAMLIVCGYHYPKLVVVLGVESNIKPKTSLLVCAR